MTAHASFAKPPALKDQVYNMLREQVRMGAMAPNERWVDATIAKEMEISRTPVREALQLLVHEGLLETTTRGFKLLELSQTEVGHLFELRLVLEPLVARAAALNAQPGGAARLLECVERANAATQDETPARFNTAVYQFFEAMTELCSNRAMARSVLLYHDRLAQLRVRMMASAEHRRLAVIGFSAVAVAISEGDAQTSQDAQHRHIELGIEACRSLGLLTPS